MSEDIQKDIIKNDDEVFVKVSLKHMKELTAYAFSIIGILEEIRDNHKLNTTKNIIKVIGKKLKMNQNDVKNLNQRNLIKNNQMN